jgi:hypothetical protein
VEFSEDDAAAYGVPYTEFRAAKLTYPATYPASKEVASYTLLGTAGPTPVRVENGKQIYAITVPLTQTGSTCGAVPKMLWIPADPENPGATAIGTNTITWTWNDNSANETGFKVWADLGSNTPTTLRTTTAANVTSWQQDGLSPNMQYTVQVAAVNANGESAKTTPLSAWTLAMPPVAPTVNNATSTSLNVAIGTGDSNPVATEYAIQCTTSGKWIQPSGTQSASPSWQTAAAWSTKTVTGLSPNTTYGFVAMTRNGNGELAGPGPETFATTVTAVPDVIGLTPAEAEAALAGAYLSTGAVTQLCSSTVAAGHVLSQTPLAGQQADIGSTVALTVSTGRCPVAVPNVVGQTQASATTAITGAGLTVGTVTQQYHATILSGQVINQTPVAGTQVAPGSSVALAVSKGPQPVEGESEGEGEPPTPPTADQVRELLAAGFNAADTGGDGLISFSDASAAIEGLTLSVFNELDTNGDGALDKTELGIPEDEESGCNCNKSYFTPEALKKRLGDLFLSGLMLGALTLWGSRRNRP